jgi:opacity protein-like surface antigen
MMRVTRLAVMMIAIGMTGVNAARAQDEAGRFYATVNGGVTFGNKSGGSFGGEVGGRVIDPIEVFVEFGHMSDVGTSELQSRANLVANFINGTATTQQKANYFDVGVKYRARAFAGTWRPYVGFGIGTAKVETISTFLVNGNDVTSQLPVLYGVVLGNDLSGSLNKTFLTIPIGVQGIVFHRLLVDGSYRYGHLFAKPDEIDGDVGITAQRLQIGVGVRF